VIYSKFNENLSSGCRVVPHRQTDRHDEAVAHFCNFAKAPKNYIFKLMVNFSNNDSGNMKQVQKIENYLCLEAPAQCHNKWMPCSKDQNLLFSDGGRHIATTDDLGLLLDLNVKTLVRSI
jgi:hypothetical protein